MSLSVHHSEGTEPPLCIIYALVELIETENVMFHSSALLIGRFSLTRLVRLLQNTAMSLDEFLKSGMGIVGMSDRLFILGVSASWEQCSINGSLIMDVFFLALPLCLPVSEGTEPWQIKQDGSASLAQLEGSPPIPKKTGRQAGAKVASLSNCLRG